MADTFLLHFQACWRSFSPVGNLPHAHARWRVAGDSVGCSDDGTHLGLRLASGTGHADLVSRVTTTTTDSLKGWCAGDHSTAVCSLRYTSSPTVLLHCTLDHRSWKKEKETALRRCDRRTDPFGGKNGWKRLVKTDVLLHEILWEIVVMKSLSICFIFSSRTSRLLPALLLKPPPPWRRLRPRRPPAVPPRAASTT